MANPPSSGNVRLLLHFDGEDEQTTTVDSSQYEHTVDLGGGYGALTTLSPKFGTACLLGDTAVSPTTDLRFSDGTEGNHYLATLEFQLRADETGSASLLEPSTGLIGPHMYCDGADLYFAFLDGDGFPYISLTALDAAPQDDEWRHIAIDLTADYISLYVDGVLLDQASVTGMGISNSSASALLFGAAITPS
jgi:hypothetical protein